MPQAESEVLLLKDEPRKATSLLEPLVPTQQSYGGTDRALVEVDVSDGFGGQLVLTRMPLHLEAVMSREEFKEQAEEINRKYRETVGAIPPLFIIKAWQLCLLVVLFVLTFGLILFCLVPLMMVKIIFGARKRQSMMVPAMRELEDYFESLDSKWNPRHVQWDLRRATYTYTSHDSDGHAHQATGLRLTVFVTST